MPVLPAVAQSRFLWLCCMQHFVSSSFVHNFPTTLYNVFTHFFERTYLFTFKKYIVKVCIYISKYF